MSVKQMVVAWDLDDTLIQPNKDRVKITNGVFDLDFWIEGDTLLPLSEIFFKYQEIGFTQMNFAPRHFI